MKHPLLHSQKLKSNSKMFHVKHFRNNINILKSTYLFHVKHFIKNHLKTVSHGTIFTHIDYLKLEKKSTVPRET